MNNRNRAALSPEPVASWGVVSQADAKEPVDGWKAALKIGLGRPNPLFLSSSRVENWQEIASELRPAEFQSVEYMARPVAELKTADIVEQIVVVPLVRRLQELQTRAMPSDESVAV
jgi:hypothetical protein